MGCKLKKIRLKKHGFVRQVIWLVSTEGLTEIKSKRVQAALGGTEAFSKEEMTNQRDRQIRHFVDMLRASRKTYIIGYIACDYLANE